METKRLIVAVVLLICACGCCLEADHPTEPIEGTFQTIQVATSSGDNLVPSSWSAADAICLEAGFTRVVDLRSCDSAGTIAPAPSAGPFIFDVTCWRP